MQAGGAIFAEAITDTERFIYSNIELARRLGITAAEAGVLDVALGDSFVSVGVFEGAVGTLSRQLYAYESLSLRAPQSTPKGEPP